VLALLALAAFPVFAHAGGIPEYEVEKSETELPHQDTTVKPKPQGSQHHASPTNPSAEGSALEGEKNSGSKSEPSEETESESSSGGGGGTGSNGNGGNHSGGNKTNAQAKPDNKIGGAEKVATASGNPASSSSNGGSSPIVPILIAVAVLAAISIGVVLYRQRKGDSGPGSDRRVSSPNAS
jgi:cobalamin biosynthesis Mg chelatase CobN